MRANKLETIRTVQGSPCLLWPHSDFHMYIHVQCLYTCTFSAQWLITIHCAYFTNNFLSSLRIQCVVCSNPTQGSFIVIETDWSGGTCISLPCCISTCTCAPLSLLFADGLVVCHLPYGPTASFSLSNTVMRHDLPDVGTMSEAYPHLIFHNFKTNLGLRVGLWVGALHKL